ncbi:ATP-binding protein [Synechococcus sp. A15-44]|uniref:ATP-binding protein n=1 Tax=Synechococcus sp. A15-44 TaxID=1050646 RepID=UPI002106AD60|nr:ATP-binding protein [Synechococcus sp. A15-44]
MQLIRMTIKNFRCYSNETTLNINNLTAIIGRNDVGKSALLDALDAFFNDSIEAGDLSTTATGNTVEITCFFKGMPSEVVLDTSVSTSPEDEGLLNSQGLFEMRKVFTFGARKTSAIYLNCNHLSDTRLANLLSLKNTQLKNLAEELGVDLDGVDKRKNPPIRQAIRNHIGGNRAEVLLKVDGSVDNEDNLKVVWKSLKKLLPIYSLFKSDKSFDDKDGDVKSPLQAAIDEALALDEIRQLLDQVEEKVREFSTEVADRTIEKLKNFDESIAERLRSEFGKTPSYSKIFDLTLLNDVGIPLNKRGSGIRRLVILSFFQAQAEKRKAEAGAPAIIYAIEEPETSQHPNHQRMIIDSLDNLANSENVQVLFTTHSANLAREIPTESLRYISNEGEDGIAIELGAENGVKNEEVIDKIIAALGILPNPADRVKLLLYVEGNHDVNALKRYSVILSAHDQSILNLNETDSVGYVITGGSALKHYLEQKHLDGLGKPEVHVYDNDIQSYKMAVQAINDDPNPSKVAFNTVKNELENYLHKDAIEEAYASQGTSSVSIGDISNEMDVPVEVAKKFNELNANNWDDLPEEKKKEKASDKKKLLNTIAVEKMTVERLKKNGGYADIHSWLSAVSKFASS